MRTICLHLAIGRLLHAMTENFAATSVAAREKFYFPKIFDVP